MKHLKNLLYLPKLVVAAYRLMESWELVARNKFREAEKMLEGFERVVRTIPNYAHDYEYYIKKGKIAFRLKKRSDCANALKEAWQALENAVKISLHDKNYLKEYIASSLRIYKEHNDYDEDFFEEISMADVDLGKVSKHLQRNFPMRNHPDWYKYNKE